MRRTTAAAALSVSLAVLALTGCGIDDGGNGSQAPVASNSPDCADVWKVGATLPTTYDGCLEVDQQDNALDAAVIANCDDDSSLTTYDDRYWAELGGKVQDSGTEGGLDADAAYQAAVKACTG